MVFFTCGACGESLKKAQVEKHVHMCRGCTVLSCIDCGKDFWGDDYKQHLQCISEEQKYGGKDYEGKANKGQVKQQQWLQKIHVALAKPGVSAGLQSVLQQVAAYDNVPRKKAKFQNWMKNSLKISSSSLHEQVWDVLSSEPVNSSPPAAEEEVDQNGESNNMEKKKLNKRERKEARRQQNGGKATKNNQEQDQDQHQDQHQHQDQDQDQKKKERKRKHRHEEQNGTKNKKIKAEESTTQDEEPEEPEEPQEAEERATKGKFNWKGNIRAVLRASQDQELPLKKLRRKVLCAFYSFSGESLHKSEEEVLALFNKKINKNPKFRVLKDRVKLIQ